MNSPSPTRKLMSSSAWTLARRVLNHLETPSTLPGCSPSMKPPLPPSLMPWKGAASYPPLPSCAVIFR